MGTLRARTGIFCFLLIFCCTISTSCLWAIKSASIVICAETGKVHHEQNADAPIPPASLTKMMTLYLTFKALQEGKLTFHQRLPVSKRASLAAPCKLGLKAGSTITVREAILGMVTKSANDASIVIAEALGKGSEAHFASIMTHQARHLGMSKTVFKNSHGLPDKPHNVSTARDMATLSRSLYKHFPEFFKFFKETKFSYKGQVHPNHNRLLGKIPGLDGIKTGFINASGFNLAASVVRNNRRIIAVVLGGESRQKRDKKIVALLEAAYSNLKGKRCTPQQENHDSIEDLICALSPSEGQATPIKARIHQAVYREQCRPINITKAKYTSVAHLLNDLDGKPKNKPTLKKKVQKSPLKKKHKDKSRIRKIENKKTLRVRKRQK